MITLYLHYVLLSAGAKTGGFGMFIAIWVLLVWDVVLAFAIGMSRHASNQKQAKYPYRPGIEFRLPNGEITTKGYAAIHPGEFRHWQGGRYVMGEVINSTDWENWRVNFFGME